MVSDNGIIDYDEVKHEEIDDIDKILIKNKKGKVIGYVGSRYQILVKDQHLDIPKEIRDSQEGCLNDLMCIEQDIFSNAYEDDIHRFREDILSALDPYINALETERIKQAQTQMRTHADELNELVSRYIPEEQEELDSEAKLISSKYNINDPALQRYEGKLPKSLQGDRKILDFFALVSVTGTDRIVSEYVKKLGEEADKKIYNFKKG